MLTAMVVNPSRDPIAPAFITRQLAFHGMELIVAAIALILGLACLRRYPGPAGLTAGAAALLLAATIGTTLYQVYLFQEPFHRETFHAQMAVAAQIGTAPCAVALALLVGAVFTGRKRPT